MAYTGYIPYHITPRVTHIACETGVYATLVTGEQGAILFDTAFGAGDLRGYVAGLTALPLTVINSHYHQDHSWGNGAFPETYMHPADIPFYHEEYTPECRRTEYGVYGFLVREGVMTGEEFERWAELPAPPVRPLADGQSFDLGGLTVRVVHLPGHTAGCVGLLIEEERILLSGDMVGGDIWMGLPGCAGMEALAASTARVLSLPVDRCLGGHGAQPMTLDAARALLYHCERFPAQPGERLHLLGEDNMRYSCRTPYGLSCVTMFGEGR